MASQYSTGTVAVGAVGTVTYRNGQTVYAFGHPLDDAGRRSLILQDAYVYYVVNNPNVADNTSYKLASAGHTVGTLSSDTPNAVIGQLGAAPAMVPIDVVAHDLDTGSTLTQRTQVADETDVGLPLGSSLVELVAPLAIAQAATQVYNGPPASESGRMCLTVMVREVRGPLRFCNRYVSTGTSGAGMGVPPALALLASIDSTTSLGTDRRGSVRGTARHARHRADRCAARPARGEDHLRERPHARESRPARRGAVAPSALPGRAAHDLVQAAHTGRRPRPSGGEAPERRVRGRWCRRWFRARLVAHVSAVRRRVLRRRAIPAGLDPRLAQGVRPGWHLRRTRGWLRLT